MSYQFRVSLFVIYGTIVYEKSLVFGFGEGLFSKLLV